MANINLVIADNIDKRFREKVAKRLGMKKGNIKIAVEEALGEWIEKEDN